MAVDTYPQSGGMDSPASRAFTITPSDASNLTTYTRGLYCGGTGNLTVTLVSDSASVTFNSLGVGYHPLRIKKVHATGTTATNLVGLA